VALILGHVYKINELQPDGAGFTQLQLKEVGPHRFLASPDAGGYQYMYPFDYGTEEVGSAPDADPDNPRLLYPYTVETYLDFDTNLVAL